MHFLYSSKAEEHLMNEDKRGYYERSSENGKHHKEIW